MDLGEGAADFYVYAAGCMVTSILVCLGLRGFVLLGRHQLEHGKSQATEQSGHPSWLTPQPPPTSWVESSGFAPTSLHRDSFEQGHITYVGLMCVKSSTFA